ncbi:MAG TPA: hypothetical protein VJU81_08425 [Methylomirabilota bacterium]|nr:hypothetical protein [Methylomirabilota bacterium]
MAVEERAHVGAVAPQRRAEFLGVERRRRCGERRELGLHRGLARLVRLDARAQLVEQPVAVEIRVEPTLNSALQGSPLLLEGGPSLAHAGSLREETRQGELDRLAEDPIVELLGDRFEDGQEIMVGHAPVAAGGQHCYNPLCSCYAISPGRAGKGAG